MSLTLWVQLTALLCGVSGDGTESVTLSPVTLHPASALRSLSSVALSSAQVAPV